MADKPKRVITAEQQEKMRLGRQKAYEERKAKKEAEVRAKKEAKEKQKAIQQQALREQKERRNNLKSAIEQRAEQKAKLKELKKKKPNVATDEEIEYYEPDVLSPVEEEDAEGSENDEISDEAYKEKFISETDNIIKTLPKESRKLFKKATNKFDYNLSIEDNIKSMIEYVKMVVQHNITTAQAVKQHIENKPLKEKEVVQEIPEVVEAEQIIESKMNYLMTKWK